MIGPLILVLAFGVLLYRKKMKRSTRIWLVLIFSLSIIAITTAGISWDGYVRKAPSHPVIDYLCLGTALISTLSILPSFLWAIVLVASKRWEESVGMLVALLFGMLTFFICDSSWPILRI